MIMSFTPPQSLLNVNDDGSLVCDALGGPRLVITIQREGSTVATGTMGDDRLVYNFTAIDGTLGDYTCSAAIDNMEMSESVLVVGMYNVCVYVCVCVCVCVCVLSYTERALTSQPHILVT